MISSRTKIERELQFVAIFVGISSCVLNASSQTILSTSPQSTPTVSQSVTGSYPPSAQSSSNVSPSGTAGQDSGPSSIAIPELRIGTGDLLQVGIFGVPEFAQQVRVSPSGDISLPPLGSLHIDGLSPQEAELLVRQKLVEGGFFKDPHVSVFQKEYATQGVSVMGEVNKPGVYPLLGSHTLLDLISAAGGLTPRAGTKVIVKRRDSRKQPVTVKLSKDSMGTVGGTTEVFPGDTIMVSPAGIIYVVGDVAKPSGFVMDNENLTILQAVALAGGANPTAALDRSTLIRGKDNDRQQISIPLKKILQAKANDLPLQADDIIFIPNSASKTAWQRGLQAVVQAATGVAIYSTPRH